jgi:prevent-host-death family protein
VALQSACSGSGKPRYSQEYSQETEVRVGVLEAKNRFSELLEAAQRGEEVVITKRGEPVATLHAIRKGLSGAEADALMQRVRARRERLALNPTIEELKSDIDAGRRY